MFARLKTIVTAPFRWGFEAVDTRPSGKTYRRFTNQLHAVQQEDGKVALTVGKGLTDTLRVVDTIKANTPAEAVNATLKLVGGLRRTKAKAVNQIHRAMERDARQKAKAAAAEAKAKKADVPAVGEPALA